MYKTPFLRAFSSLVILGELVASSHMQITVRIQLPQIRFPLFRSEMAQEPALKRESQEKQQTILTHSRLDTHKNQAIQETHKFMASCL